MKKLKVKKTQEACKERWLNRMLEHKEWSQTCCNIRIQQLIKLLKELTTGYVAICYRQKDDTTLLVCATLINYESFFGHPFRWENQNCTIPYWDIDNSRWSTFQIDNLVQWRTIY